MSVLVASETTPEILFPESFQEAVALLAASDGARIFAGGTWLMRSAIRGERLPPILISLDRIEQAGRIGRNGNGWTIGPMVTHAALAEYFEKAGDLRVIASAAGNSANPGVRRLATIGGNIATAEFAAADLLPVLLALDASVMVATSSGLSSQSMEGFLQMRARGLGKEIVAGIDIQDDGFLSAHVRQTMREAGDYPVAIVSVSARISSDARILDARIAVGAVETVASRWRDLETELAGNLLDLAAIESLAKRALAKFTPRVSADAPSWYRLDVLPHLVRRAFADIEGQIGGRVDGD